MRAIDVLRERRAIGAADHEAARLFRELPPADPRCLAAHRALAALGEEVRAIVVAVALHDRLPQFEGRSAVRWQEAHRGLDALERGLEALAKALGVTAPAPRCRQTPSNGRFSS